MKVKECIVDVQKEKRKYPCLLRFQDTNNYWYAITQHSGFNLYSGEYYETIVFDGSNYAEVKCVTIEV